MDEHNPTIFPLNLIWAKSDAGGCWHSLPGHLADTMAVAELIWDQFMAPGFKQRISQYCGGQGREVYLLIAGWHDVGKATPVFEAKRKDLAADLLKQGNLSDFSGYGQDDLRWHHTHAGRAILEDYLNTTCPQMNWSWLPIIIEGHHGYFKSKKNRRGRGGDEWKALQRRLCEWVEEQVGIRLADINSETPPRSVQLELAGFVVMADWIASSEFFPGLGKQPASLLIARERARKAWDALGLRGGWVLPPGKDVSFAERFGMEPRPFQAAVMEMANSMERPGLLLVEAPMGEGKTETALAAVEILSRRFGCDGFAFAMPTQGTTDAMYERCSKWAKSVDPSFPVSLLHGKAMLNDEWREKLEAARQSATITGVYGEEDEFGLRDDYGSSGLATGWTSKGQAPSDWLLGRHRTLLSPGIVMTVDQLLFAGTRTKFVMLRHAGLAGKVVIIDEVHSYDIYMESFLDEVLTWLGQADVPVILMSATLPPEQRDRLVKAYSGGRPEMPAVTGYPMILSTSFVDGQVQCGTTPTWRRDLDVEVEILGDSGKDVHLVADRILKDMKDGGCALAIMNTVGRAQELARDLRDAEQEVLLIHGRLTSAERADRTQRAIALLGKDKTRQTGRPRSLVVVATQIAEQSFDVDADILYTDLAPMDLLLQRVGRLHRHDRPADDRPEGMRISRVVVLGVSMNEMGCSYPASFGKHIYDPWALIRSAAALEQASTWRIPSDVPRLVEEAYSQAYEGMPSAWRPEEEKEKQQRDKNEERRARRAQLFRLSEKGQPFRPDLRDLHRLDAGDDESIVVRDGDSTLEVSLVVDKGDHYETLGGNPLGPHGERCTSAVAREILGDGVRVWDEECFRDLKPLPGWKETPVLRFQGALVLTPDLKHDFADRMVSYDMEYGLSIERKKQQ